MKKYLWPLLFSLLFLLSAASSYILYDTNVKMEKEYQAALEGAYKTIHKRIFGNALLLFNQRVCPYYKVKDKL